MSKTSGLNPNGTHIGSHEPLIEIICKIHGSFFMTPANHLGENQERIAYGCPKCKDEKELFEGAPHQMPTLEELEARVCACGELIEKCEDAYEHITQGV